MKGIKITILSIGLFFIAIISCKNIKNSTLNPRQDETKNNSDSLSSFVFSDPNFKDKVVWFSPNRDLDSGDYKFVFDPRRDPIFKEDLYQCIDDSITLKICDKSFDAYFIRPGSENVLRSDTMFLNCFLNHFSKTKGFKLTQDEIIDLIDKYEEDFIKNYNYETEEIVLENELNNTTQWYFSRNNPKKIIYSLDIPQKFNQYIAQCEEHLLLKDTLTFNRLQKELVSELLNTLKDSYTRKLHKENLLKVVGYFIFVRYKNSYESSRINKAILPYSDNSGVHDFLKKNQLEQLSYLLAKYNAHLYVTSGFETFFSAAYYFYAKYDGMPSQEKEELIRFLMYSNSNEALHKKALDLLEGVNYLEGVPDRWFALRSEVHKSKADSYYGSVFTDSIKKHQIISANSILHLLNRTKDTFAMAIVHGSLGSIYWRKGRLEDALYYDFTYHSLGSKISSYETRNRNFGQTILNIPFYLYKLGQKKEAIYLYEYIMQKKFHKQYYTDNLQMRFDILLYDKQFSLAKSTCMRMLDSAEKKNDENLKYRSYYNFILLAKAEGNTDLEKNYTTLAFNTYVSSYNSNPYLSGVVDVIDSKNTSLFLADSLFISQNLILENNKIITHQQHSISSLNKDIVIVNDSLTEITNQLADLNDSLKVLDNTIRSKIDTIGTLKYLDSTKNVEITAKNLALLQKDEAIKAEKKAKYIGYGIAGALLVAICLVFWSSRRFYREKVRANASEANQRILSRTMYQLGHLGPQCINNLVTSVEEESGMDRSKLVSRLDGLSELLRKFYDYSKEKFITYRDEYDLACAYVDIAYEKKDQTILPSDIIKSNYKEKSEVIMPTFVAFNAIQNAFKHGKIANYNVTDNVPLLNIQLSNCNNNVLQMKIENKKKVHENSTKLGSGLNFIEGALQYWNGDKKNKKKYSTIDETEDKFILTYFFKSKHSDEV